jgi:hypothetical protein
MPIRRLTLPLSLLLLLAALAACSASSTRLTSTWKDPSVTGPLQFKKALVVAILQDADMRRQVEGQITVVMKNTEGIPSYIAIPESAIRDREKVKSICTSNGIEGAITVRLLDARTTTEWVPTSYGGFYDYWGYAWPLAMTSGYIKTDTVFKIETKVYSLKDGKLVWAGLSDSWNPTSGQQLLLDLAAKIGEDLRKDGLVQ